MYELSVALRYLIPRRRQLSVSIIALLSVVVISLVVWLVVVFLSVTQGIERRWIETMVSLNAPVRVIPTEAYYQSYYYQVDGHSLASDYTFKTLAEKLAVGAMDPYDPELDPEVPATRPEKMADLVGELFAAANGIEGVRASDYEAAIGQLNLQLSGSKRLSQVSYVSSFDGEFAKTLVPVKAEDLAHYFILNQGEEFFDHARIVRFRVGEGGWHLPSSLYPEKGSVKVQLANGRYIVSDKGEEKRSFGEGGPALFLEAGTLINAELVDPEMSRFRLSFKLQGISFDGEASPHYLEFDQVKRVESSSLPPWMVPEAKVLPAEGILLASSFQKQGARLGDRGHISYCATREEQKIPVYVAGFYDPGLTPGGSKVVLANREITSEIRGSMQLDAELSNGVHLWFDDVYQADEVKSKLVASLEERGINEYWRVETYKEYPVAKPLIDQFQSDRMLFSLIAVIIILVACSNIISMLILLVNDKRRDIGIMRAMGASGRSIAVIFSGCGMALGLLGSTVGIVTAIFTLRHLDRLISLLSAIQGHEAFNAMFFGGELPNELSWSVLVFVVGATIVISIIAGLIPALKAIVVRPSTILRGQ